MAAAARAPRRAQALLLIDFINDFDFPTAGALAGPALAAARRAARRKARARDAGVPAIYVNDNFHLWRHDFGAVVRHCAAAHPAAQAIADLLRPGPEDFNILKPKNSAFYETPLHTLLSELRARELILTGLSADNCVLFTANDAHLREYTLVVARDCVASASKAAAARALAHMATNLSARVLPAAQVRFTRGAG